MSRDSIEKWVCAACLYGVAFLTMVAFDPYEPTYWLGLGLSATSLFIFIVLSNRQAACERAERERRQEIMDLTESHRRRIAMEDAMMEARLRDAAADLRSSTPDDAEAPAEESDNDALDRFRTIDI